MGGARRSRRLPGAARSALFPVSTSQCDGGRAGGGDCGAEAASSWLGTGDRACLAGSRTRTPPLACRKYGGRDSEAARFGGTAAWAPTQGAAAYATVCGGGRTERRLEWRFQTPGLARRGPALLSVDDQRQLQPLPALLPRAVAARGQPHPLLFRGGV